MKSWKIQSRVIADNKNDFDKVVTKAIEMKLKSNEKINIIKNFRNANTVQSLKSRNNSISLWLKYVKTFTDIFYLEGDKLICTDIRKWPINIKPYRLSLKHRLIIQEQT